MLYQALIPIPTEDMQQVEFGFLHPALINPIASVLGLNQNDPNIPARAYHITVPMNCNILAPIEGTIIAKNYSETIPKKNAEAHQCNYIEIQNADLILRINHMSTHLTTGSKVRQGETIGELYGFIGRHQDTDAHIHVQVKMPINSKLQLLGLPNHWKDYRRVVANDSIDAVLEANLPYQIARNRIWAPHGPRQQIKDTIRACINNERQHRKDVKEVRFDLDF